MKYSILFKCSTKDYTYLIKKIVDNNINIIHSYQKDNESYFITYEDEYNILLKLDYKKIIIFVGYKGIYNILNYIKYNYLYIMITLSIILIMFISNIFIIKVNIHTSNQNLNRMIKYYLMDNNIKDFSLKKNYNTLNKIKNKILDKYENYIEWLEIKEDGYNYDVYLIERKKNKIYHNNERCNYIAKKSGTITKIIARKGVLLVQENNYVNQGDILISGNIIYNEELKKSVCAQGKIYGEVWYEVDISYPLTKTYNIKSKKNHYNFKINFLNKKYIIFKNKYDESKVLRKIGNNTIGIDIISSYKIKKKKYKINEEKAINIMLKKAKENVSLKSSNDSKILSQNILKKYINNGTIYMKVLITAEEELGVVESY